MESVEGGCAIEKIMFRMEAVEGECAIEKIMFSGGIC